MPILDSTYFLLFLTEWPLLAITYFIFLHFRFLLSQSAEHQISTSFAFFYFHSPPNIQLCHILDHSSWPAIPWAFHCECEHGQVLCEGAELVPYSACGSSTDVAWHCSALWRASAVQHPSEAPPGLVGPTHALTTAPSPTGWVETIQSSPKSWIPIQIPSQKSDNCFLSYNLPMLWILSEPF